MTLLITLLIVVGLVGLAFFGLAIQIIFRKTHKFPNMHIGGNKNMLERGITCAQSWDKNEQKKRDIIVVEELRLDDNHSSK
ncbi:MAG TPA: hypothetical protein VJY41_10845 [Prolixibacteraceae bacterium]|nr:hypothetical protein [Prolixibacteraceae bacterium]